jgi:hypothetical protein
LNSKEIAKNLSIPLYQVYQGLKDEIVTNFLKLHSIKDMKTEFGIRDEILSKMLKNEGLVIPFKGLSSKIRDHFGNGTFPFFKPFEEKAEEMIEAELLGDGFILRSVSSKEEYHNQGETTDVPEYLDGLKTIKNFIETDKIENLPEAIEKFNESVNAIMNAKISLFGLNKALKEEKYVEKIAELFTRHGYQTKLNINRDREFPNVLMTTANSIQMQKMRERWYNGTTKIVPEDLKLNVNKIFQWYIGDGSYSKNGHQVSFATHSFKEPEVRTLASKLDDEIGINSHVYKTLNQKQDGSYGEYWFIQFTKKEDVNKFFEYLDGADKELLDVAQKELPHKFGFD